MPFGKMTKGATGALVAGASVALMLTLGASAATAQQALFTAVAGDLSPAAADKAQAARDARGAEAVNIVGVDLDALGEQVSVSLPGGATYTINRTSTDVRGVSDYSWTGEIPGNDGSVSFNVRDGQLTGGIAQDGNRYTIVPLGDGAYAVTKVDQGAFPSEEAPLPGGGSLDVAGDAPASGDTAFIRVLVAYTAQAEAQYPGNIQGLIQFLIDDTNQTYINSTIDARLQLAATAKITISDNSGSSSALLDRLRAGTETEFAFIHQVRDQEAADLVVLVTGRTDGFCGIGFVVSVPSTGFSVVNWDCGLNNYTFAHEVGHNIGSDHDPANAFNPNLYAPYAHGFVFDSANPALAFRTVMSYDTTCVFNCPRVPFFSNPDIFRNGIAMGTNGTHNNTRTHKERVARVADFLSPAAPPPGPPPATGAFEPLSLLGLAGLAFVGIRRRKSAA